MTISKEIMKKLIEIANSPVKHFLKCDFHIQSRHKKCPICNGKEFIVCLKLPPSISREKWKRLHLFTIPNSAKYRYLEHCNNLEELKIEYEKIDKNQLTKELKLAVAKLLL